MVFGTTWFEFKDMAQDSLVRREPVSTLCNRWSDEGLETQEYRLYPKEHPPNCPLRWRLSNGLGVYLSWLQAGFSHAIQGNLTGNQYIRDILLLSPFRQPPTSYKACVCGWQRQASSFKSSTRLLPKRSCDFCSLANHEPDLNPIEQIWDMLGRSIQAREPPVQKIRQLEVALHREWQQLSQQDIRRRVEAVIQARGDYTRYWTLNNRCRKVIH